MIKDVEKQNFENNSDETLPPATNMLEGWYIFQLKGGSIALSGVKKHFSTTSGS